MTVGAAPEAPTDARHRKGQSLEHLDRNGPRIERCGPRQPDHALARLPVGGVDPSGMGERSGTRPALQPRPTLLWMSSEVILNDVLRTALALGEIRGHAAGVPPVAIDDVMGSAHGCLLEGTEGVVPVG